MGDRGTPQEMGRQRPDASIPKSQQVPTTARLSSRTRWGAVGLAAMGVGTFLMFGPMPPKSETGNPIETAATKNISNRFNKGGGKDTYAPAVATPTNSTDSSSGRNGEGEADARAKRHLQDKHVTSDSASKQISDRQR